MKLGFFILLLGLVMSLIYSITTHIKSQRDLRSTGSNTPYEDDGICLITPEAVFDSRIGRKRKALGNYIKRVRKITRAHFESLNAYVPLSGVVFVGVRPGFSSRAWVVVGSSDSSPINASTLTAKIEALRLLEVKDGPILFSTSFRTWNGGEGLVSPKDFPVPFPSEWVEAFEGFRGGMLPDEALAKVWPARDKSRRHERR